jgi:hypothetical protein
MSLYEHAEEPMPPKPEYDPAMDHPEPEPARRREMPWTLIRNGLGSKSYKLPTRTIITANYGCIKYAIILTNESINEPHLTVGRKDVARILRHYRKEASC